MSMPAGPSAGAMCHPRSGIDMAAAAAAAALARAGAAARVAAGAEAAARVAGKAKTRHAVCINCCLVQGHVMHMSLGWC